MKKLICCFLLLFTSLSFANQSHPDLRPFSEILGAKVYVGFGLARDMVNHVYKKHPFQPRDYDLAIVGSNLNEEQAIKALSEHGRIVKTLDMYREEIKPSGNVFAYHYGFVVIIETIDGTQIDFKFFKTVEDAHTRGLFDVEKVLIPLQGRTLEAVVGDLADYKKSGKAFKYSDPHNGFESILAKTPKTVNWAKAKASGFDWILRGAMITAKLGAEGFRPSERRLMIEKLGQIQYLRDSDLALLKRAVAHKRSWKVKALLEDLGFFEHLKTWLWSESATELIDQWRAPAKAMSCNKII